MKLFLVLYSFLTPTSQSVGSGVVRAENIEMAETKFRKDYGVKYGWRMEIQDISEIINDQAYCTFCVQKL